jgi:hypothetical protein
MVRSMQLVLALILLLTITATTDERTDRSGDAERKHIGSGRVRPAMICGGPGQLPG